MLSLNDREWENFKLTDIFDNISRGTRLTKYNRLPGNTPLITAGYQNYGVGGYISNSDQKRFSNAITIDMFCNVFYRGLEFCCDDNIIVLQNSKLNKYQMQFMVPLIQAKSCNYSYGNQYRLDDLKRHEVLLPIECNGNPDYDFMEQYVRESTRL